MNGWKAAPAWIVAIVSAGAALYWLRDVLAPFVLALILWLAIDSLAAYFRRRLPILPSWTALSAALAFVLGFGALVVLALARNASAIAIDAAQIEPRFNALARDVQAFFRIDAPPVTLRQLLAELGPTAIMGWIVGALQALTNQTTLILIYLLFLFPAAGSFGRKLPQIAPEAGVRASIEKVLGRIRLSVERYLAMQTAVSLVISILSYFTLLFIGLPNALFWSALIFFLNYIPTIGSIIAVALPTLFALVAFPDWRMAGAVALGLHIWQFGIGTFIQPRLTGASVNLSAIVVVLALAIWGSLWGIIGVFLAAPITVLIMIVLEQFPATHWLAVLLSAEGRPMPWTGDHQQHRLRMQAANKSD